MVHDYAEDLLKSMKIVAEYCFNDQHFDETLICTIVDNQDAKNGHYIVSDGTIKFDAYSDVMDYKINDAVRVTVLKGDYTQKKYITGKSVSENMSQPLTYVAPSDTVLDMTNNIFDRKGSWGTMANGGKEKQLQCIWSANLNDEQFKHIQTSSIYDAIILKADFKTLLGQYNLVKGSFGLRLDMYISTSSDHSTGILKRGYLDSSDMFGDFYNFVVYTNQEAKFNIGQDEIIHTMSLYLYENEDFYNQDDGGKYQKIDPLAELLKIDNILVSNIYIGLGTNLINVEDNRLVITTEDDLNYNLDNSLVHNYKNIKLVWYNKDDNNKYIGFSDGRVSRDEDTIIDYDEKKYLEKANEHQLYVKQLGKEDVPNDLDGLKLSSYLEKIKSPLSQLTQLIDRDLTQEIKRFRSRLQNILDKNNNEEIQIFEQALNNIEDALTAFEKAKEDILITNLENSLKCAAAVQRGKGAWSDGKYVENEITYEPGTVKSLSDAIANVNKALSDIHTAVMQNLLPQTRSLILSRDPAYIGSYNNYSDRLSAILKQLEQQESTLTSIIEVLTDDSEEPTDFEIYNILDDLIKKINGDAKFEEYNIVDEENKLKDYDNKYSIYWYYYNLIGGNDPDPFVDENWQLLKSQAEDIEVLDLTDSVTLQNENSNIGLPEIIDSKDEYYPATGSGDHSVAKIILLPNNSIEKIKAVLVYNHEAFTSNEITFTNANPSVDIELIDNIVIEHGNYSMPTYAKYGVDNTLISLSDQSQCRELILNYYTEHGALDNSQLQDATIYWYMPAASTMLKVAKNLNISSEDEEGFIPEIATAAFNVISPGNTITRLERTEIRTINDNKYIYQGVVYTINGETPSGKIVEEKDGTVAIKETIDVQGSTFEFQGKTYRIDGRNVIDSDEKKYTIKNNIVNLPLLFNATESEYHRDGFICYQKRITDFANDNKFYYQIEDYYSSAFTNNTIYCKIVKGNAKLEASIELNFSTFGSNGTDYSLIIKPFNSSGALIPTMSKDGEVQQYSYDFEVNLYDYDNNPVDLVEEQHKVSVEIIGSQESYGSGSYNDGTYSNIITTYCKIDNKPISYRVLKVDVNVKIDPSEEEGDRTVLLSAYRPIPYAASDNLRYQGPTTIIYDSSGANPSYYKGLLKLFEFDESSGDLKELNDVDWEIEYYDDEGAKIEELTGILSSYMPTIKSDKTLAPSVMYLTSANCNPVLLAKRNDDIVWWAQPIYISQNRYASPMLNNWDNKLTIDEKNGTILSNFVGAGKKNENNSFSGVLMGEIEAQSGIEIDGADDDLLTRSLATNHTGIGLYGFNEGTQSFGFNINGTAFLGKSGGGRISFDGNHGFIYSQNWLNSFKIYETYEEGENPPYPKDFKEEGDGAKKYWSGRYSNPFVIDAETGNVSLSSESKDGMAIDLQNGHIDAYNFKLTSDGIQLNASPENDENYFLIGHKNNTYLEYKADGSLGISVSNGYINATTFKLDAWVNDMGLYLNSLPNLDDDEYYFKVGNPTNYIKFKDDLEISAYHFALDAWNDTTSEGLYLNSSGEDYYFKVGNSVNYIQFKDDLEVKTQQFLLDAWHSDSGLYLNSNSNLDYYLRIGNTTNYITYSTDGKLIINTPNFTLDADGNVNIEGKITASSGSKIGGWTIAANGIYKSDNSSYRTGMYSSWTKEKATIANYTSNNWCFVAGSNKEYKFGVTKDGILAAQEAYISGTIAAKSGSIGNNFYIRSVADKITVPSLLSQSDAYQILYEATPSIIKKGYAFVSGLYPRGNPGTYIKESFAINTTGIELQYIDTVEVVELNTDYLRLDVQAIYNKEWDRVFSNLDLKKGTGKLMLDVGKIAEEETGMWAQEWTVKIVYAYKETASGDFCLADDGSLYIAALCCKGQNPSFTIQPKNSGWVIGSYPSNIEVQGSWKFNQPIVGSIISGSDRLLKDNIIQLPNDICNTIFDSLLPVNYSYKDDKKQRIHFGFIAQDIRSILNRFKAYETNGIVYEDDKDHYLALNYSEFIALNTWQIQQLKVQVQEQNTLIKTLLNEIREIKDYENDKQ